MHIQSINSMNKYKFILKSKNQNIVIHKVNNVSLPYSSISFGQITSSKTEDEEKISKAIAQLKAKNEEITDKATSEMTGLPISTVYMRIGYNPCLRELYNGIDSKEKASESGLHSTDSSKNLTSREMKALKILREKARISEILKEAKENGVKLSIRDISRLTGFSNTLIQARISSDNDLHCLFHEVMFTRSTKYTKEEIEEQTQKIHKLLSTAYESGFSISIEFLAQSLSINPQTVYRRIDANAQLKELWKLIGESGNLKTRAKIEFEINSIKDEIEQAIKEQRQLTTEEISDRTKISAETVSKRIEKSPELSALMNKLRKYSIAPTDKTQDNPPIEEQSKPSLTAQNEENNSKKFKSKIILGMIADARMKNSPVPYIKIMQSTGASMELIHSFEKIYDSQVSEQPPKPKKEAPHSNSVISERTRKQDIAKKVLKMIFDAKRSGRQISYSAIYSATTATKEEVDSILQEYIKQKKEHDKQLAIENAKAIESVKEIEKKRAEFYKKYIKDGTQKPTQAAKTEQKVEQTLDVSDIQYQIIGVMLKNAKENGYRISLATISKNLHLDEKTLYKAIKTRPDFLEIWQVVKAPELLSQQKEDE